MALDDELDENNAGAIKVCDEALFRQFFELACQSYARLLRFKRGDWVID